MSEITAHVASITIDAPATRVFQYLSDPNLMDRWSFGTWQTEIHDDGLIEGKAIFDGATTWVRIDPDPARLLIDYHLGATPAHLTPRISARVVPGPRVELDQTQAVLTLTAWRTRTMTDDRWRRLTAAHEFELVLLKSLIEGAG